MDKFFEHWINNIRNWRIKTCCCLAPLRIGLLIIGYCNVVMAVTLIVGTASDSFAPTIKHVQELVLEDDASPSVCILAPTAELAFTVLLLCGVHRNDIIILQLYVYYGIAEIVLSILIYSIVIAKISVLYILIIAFNLFYETYIIFLVRSLIIEIKRQYITKNGIVVEDKANNDETPKITITKFEKLPKHFEENVKVDIVNEKENDIHIKETNDTDLNTTKTNTITKSCIGIEENNKIPVKVETSDVKSKIKTIESKTMPKKPKTAINNKENPIKPKTSVTSEKITTIPITKRKITSNKSKEIKIDSNATEKGAKSNGVTEDNNTNNVKGINFNKTNSNTTEKGQSNDKNFKAGGSISIDSKSINDNKLNDIPEVILEESKLNRATSNETTSNSTENDNNSSELAKDEDIRKSADEKKETIPNKKGLRFWRK